MTLPRKKSDRDVTLVKSTSGLAAPRGISTVHSVRGLTWMYTFWKPSPALTWPMSRSNLPFGVVEGGVVWLVSWFMTGRVCRAEDLGEFAGERGSAG